MLWCLISRKFPERLRRQRRRLHARARGALSKPGFASQIIGDLLLTLNILLPMAKSHQLLTSSTNFIKITHCIQFLSTWVSPVYKRKDLAASRILLIQVPNHLLQRCDTVESSLFFADTPSLPNFRQRMHQTHGSLLYLRKIEVNGVFMNTDPVVNHSLLLF